MENLLLLHGAIGSEEQFAELKKMLSTCFTVHTINFSGHGGNDMPEQFEITSFAAETESYLERNNLESVNIFGYSMGGYVALYLALHYRKRISSVFTFATKFTWSPEIAQKETKMLNPDKIAEKLPAFAMELEKRHLPNDWRSVLNKTAQMMQNLGEQNLLSHDDISRISIRVRIGIGDRDSMVTLEETVAAYKSLPNGSLLVLPQTPHPLEQIDKQRLAHEIKNFFL